MVWISNRVTVLWLPCFGKILGVMIPLLIFLTSVLVWTDSYMFNYGNLSWFCSLIDSIFFLREIIFFVWLFWRLWLIFLSITWLEHTVIYLFMAILISFWPLILLPHPFKEKIFLIDSWIYFLSLPMVSYFHYINSPSFTFLIIFYSLSLTLRGKEKERKKDSSPLNSYTKKNTVLLSLCNTWLWLSGFGSYSAATPAIIYCSAWLVSTHKNILITAW